MGSIWPKRSITPWVPKSGEQLDQVAQRHAGPAVFARQAQRRATAAQLKQAKAQKEIASIGQDSGQNEIMLEQQKLEVEMAMEQQKLDQEFQLKQEQMNREFELKREQLQMEMALKREQATAEAAPHVSAFEQMGAAFRMPGVDLDALKAQWHDQLSKLPGFSPTLFQSWLQQSPMAGLNVPGLQPVQQAVEAVGHSVSDDLKSLAALKVEPDTLKSIQSEYIQRATELWNQALTKPEALTVSDRRFAAPEWTQSPVSAFMASMYLLNAQTMQRLASALSRSLRRSICRQSPGFPLVGLQTSALYIEAHVRCCLLPASRAAMGCAVAARGGCCRTTVWADTQRPRPHAAQHGACCHDCSAVGWSWRCGLGGLFPASGGHGRSAAGTDQSIGIRGSFAGLQSRAAAKAPA